MLPTVHAVIFNPFFTYLFNAIFVDYVLNLTNANPFSANKKLKVRFRGFYTSEFYDNFPIQRCRFPIFGWLQFKEIMLYNQGNSNLLNLKKRCTRAGGRSILRFKIWICTEFRDVNVILSYKFPPLFLKTDNFPYYLLWHKDCFMHVIK